MKVAIEVNNKQEATAIKAAMNDPVTRAFALVMGTLLQLPTDKTRLRVLGYVRDRLESEAEKAGDAECLKS